MLTGDLPPFKNISLTTDERGFFCRKEAQKAQMQPQLLSCVRAFQQWDCARAWNAA
jgi:hypothetical protein